MFFEKKEKITIDELVRDHLDAVIKCKSKFSEFLNIYFKEGLNENTENIVNEIDDLETAADRLRHKIIRMLIEGALLPDTRREILKLIEYVDRIANDAEEISKQIILQKIELPEQIKTHIKEIDQKVDIQIIDLENLIEKIFTDIHDVDASIELIKKIEKMETEVDKIEYAAIKELYNMEISLAEKVQLKNAISAIAGIADLIEDISDLIEIVLATRRV